MATQNATLSCSSTGSASFTAEPQETLSTTATGTASFASISQVIKSVTGTASLTLLKLTGHVLASPASHSIAVTTLKYAYTLFDELVAVNKWFITGAGRFTISAIQRFRYAVKGGL